VSSPRLRAVVLAAGHGTRLLPLTAGLPKPLLPVLGRPLLAETLERLAAIGVEATAINLHHLGDAIPAALGDRIAGMPLHYSREPAILGTLGALHPLRGFLAPADLVLLVNGDSLCRWPFTELVARHRERAPLATLLLTAHGDAATFGGVALDGEGRIVGFPGGPDHAAVARRHVFAGAHVFAPALADAAPNALSDIIRDLYAPRLAAGARLEALVTDAPWHDLGTPGRYLDAVLDWASAAKEAQPGPLDRVVVEAGATIEAGVLAREVLVLGGARVGRRCRLERVVVGPGVVIPEATTIGDALVTPRAWGKAAESREEGANVLTPLRPVGLRAAS
jgi:NDP-sugar pyrophosphorylase family protein